MTEQKRPEISIIVPVYKVEKYLNECIDSILAQTFTDFELILVDDGSPDGCPALCDAAAAKDSRIRVIHQQNKGLSGARNAGIEIARGNWLSFIDSDDSIDRTFCEKLYHAVKKYGTKMAVSNILYLEADGSVSVYKDLPLRDEVLTREEYAHRIRSTPLVHATTKLYSRDIFETFRFPVGKLYEDACILPDLLEKITETVCVAEPLYHYRINPASIMHRKVTLKNLEEVDVNYGMLCCALKYGKKDAAYLQYAIMKSYFKKFMKNLPPEDRNDPKVQQTIDLIRKAETEVRQAGADTLRNKLEAAVWFWNKTVYYHLKGWA